VKFPTIAIAALLAASLALPTEARTPVPQPPIGAPQHGRLLPLQGGQNFRDLGGYRTRDGRTVRWGLLFRSGSMHMLTPADYSYLGRLGIRTVCDFRDSRERATRPAAWPADRAPRVLSDDYALDLSSLKLDAAATPPTAEQARRAMTALYPAMLDRFNGQYRRMFAELLAGHAPLAFNCSAGKDRTGVGAALLLTALGVPRETAIEDYLLSNLYYDPARSGAQLTGAQAMPGEVMRAYSAADRRYIEAAFAVIDAHPGGADGYLRDRLGLSAADLAELRRLYTR